MIYWLVWFLLFSQSFFTAQPMESAPSVYGKWQVAHMHSVTNGKESEGSPPLMDAYWTFRNDGSYLIEAGVRETGKFTVTEKKLVMDADRPLSPDFDIRTYTIVTLSEENLRLSIPIVEVESLTMINFTDFKKVSP